MYRKSGLHTLILSILVTIYATSLWAGSTPVLNQGAKWRVGYSQGGPYSDYTHTMRTLVKGLIDLGWITKKNPPEYFDELPKPYWDWLVACDSPYLSFAPEDAYCANWDKNKRKSNRKELLSKLKSGRLDLVIAMGTWAGLDLANNEHAIPVVVMSTSDPIRAGIIKGVHNSGFDHVTARVDPTRYLRQLRMFHRIVGFKTLGVAYENTPDGRLYSGIDAIWQIAQERGFQVKLCEVVDSTAETRKSDRSCLECYRQLTRDSDAIYITALTCVDRINSEIVEILRKNRTPSFSMTGSKMVSKGLLLSISSDSGYSELGSYNAHKIGAIFNGTKPRELKQISEDPLDIAVNMETARQISFEMPNSILRVAAEIYQK